MLRVGRYTAALLLLLTGGALLLDKVIGTNYLTELLKYWPIFLIILGVEYFILNFRTRTNELRLKIDFGSIFLSIAIVVVVLVVFQGKDFSDKMEFSFDFFSSQFKGDEYVLDPYHAALGANTDKIVVENRNGNVTFITGDTDRVEIRPTIVINNQSEAKAKQLIEDTEINIKEGRTLQIEVKGTTYNSIPLIVWHPVRTNIVVALPPDRALDVKIETKNGKVDVNEIAVRNDVDVSTKNGHINLAGLNGKTLKADTKNGKITGSKLKGELKATTSNGVIELTEMDGDANVRTSNGNVYITTVSGALTARTSNGRVELTNGSGDVTIRTSNGRVTAASNEVGGDWEIQTSNGKVRLNLPEAGSFRVDATASRGSADSDLPGLKVDKRKITGQVGNGKYLVKIRSNSGVEVNKSLEH